MPWRPLVDRWSIPLGLGCVVVAFAAASSSSHWVHHHSRSGRWLVLAAVCAAIVAVAVRRFWVERRPAPRGLLRVGACAGAFLALAFLSASWSVAPRLSFERAVSLTLLFVLAAALAYSISGDVAERVRALQGLAAGAIAVGLLGLVMLAVDYHAAIQKTTPLSPWRYRGFTENPNTIAILAAASVPIMIGLALHAGGRERAAWMAGALLLVGSTVAAESRGPLLAVFVGMCTVFLFALPEWRPRLVGVTAALLVCVGGVALREVTQPTQAAFRSAVPPAPPPIQTPTTSHVTSPRPPRTTRSHRTARTARAKTAKPHATRPRATRPTGHTSTNAVTPHHKTVTPHKKRVTPHKTRITPHKNRVVPHKKPRQKKVSPPTPRIVELPRAEDEIGHPLLSRQNTSSAGSGRVAAWRGALELIRDRPILGYGFGTEARVFIDRWYYFQGGTTENSYLGLLLQLGVLGLGLILVLGLALLVRGLRTVPSLDEEARPVMAALLGVLVASAVIMVIQSFLYSVGNVATATVWISLFLLGAVVLEPRRRRARVVVRTGEGEERGALVA